MKLGSIFDVFSRRNQRASMARQKPLTMEFRNRVLMLCRDTFGEMRRPPFRQSYLDDFWNDIHNRLEYVRGTPKLSAALAGSLADDAVAHLVSCSDDEFLDFVECIFRVACFGHVSDSDVDLIGDINQLFLVDDLPYAVTNFISERTTEWVLGANREVSRVTGYPRVIRREQQFTHQEIVEPALSLLSKKGLTSANEEIVDALIDYRKGRYDDCLTKCGSAFESLMKLVCARRGWAYQQTDTASALLKTIIMKSQLEPFFEQPLILIATLRNRLSSSHGKGVEDRRVTAEKTRYALNATASAMLLLTEHCL